VVKVGEALQFDALMEHAYEALEDSQVIIVRIKKPKRFYAKVDGRSPRGLQMRHLKISPWIRQGATCIAQELPYYLS